MAFIIERHVSGDYRLSGDHPQTRPADPCDEAAQFTATIGRERLMNIAVTQGDTGGRGVIFVWYWE